MTKRLFRDQLGRTIILHKKPERIISLVPSQTELLCDLGLEDKLVGITKFCVHPTHLKGTKAIVGGTKTIKKDRIEALEPDIILCNKEENSKEIVEELEKIAVLHVSDIYTIDDCLELIEMYNDIFDCNDKAKYISGSISDNLKDFQSYMAKRKPYTAGYFIWRSPWMVAGNNTFINYLMGLNKFENLYENETGRYPEIEVSQLKQQAPELILLSSEPFPFKEKHIEELSEYATESKITLADGEFFSWYGSRLIKAFDYFKQLQEKL